MTDQFESRFWNKYIAKTKSYRIKSTVARWYVRHAEDYFKTHDNLRLSQPPAHQIEKYLREKGRNPSLEAWKFKQAHWRQNRRAQARLTVLLEMYTG